MKRILALMMSVSIATSSFSCANAIPVYADTIAGNYVSMGVMISLLFSAYGIQRTIEGSQYINDLIQQCAQEASQSGFGMLKNGIKSIGVTIQNGVSYVQKSFAEWVYNWALENNIFDVSQEAPEPQYFTFEEGTYTITSGISLIDLMSIANVPDVVKQKAVSDGLLNTSLPACIEYIDMGGTWDYYYLSVFNIGTEIVFDSNPVMSTELFVQYRYRYNKVKDTASDATQGNIRIYNTGSLEGIVANGGRPIYFYNGLNGSVVLGGDLDYGVTSDIPDVSEDLDSYASDWVNDGITVDQDGTTEDYIPVTLPIDGVGTAVGVVEGTGEAINTAGAMDQYDVREGAISPEAVQDLDKAVSDSEAEEELNDDFTIHGLEQVFPFCLPWDFAHFVGLLRAEPVAPRFELQALNADGETISYTFDMSMFDSVALVCRNMELLAFIIALILITKGFFV